MYFLDYMRAEGDKYYALALADMLQGEKREIIRVYEKPFVKLGDRARMNLMLKSPLVYYLLSIIYEKTVVRIKRGSQ